MMVTVDELRELCLFATAGHLAYSPSKYGAFSSRQVRNNMRCVLYLLVAFSLRRQKLGRRNLRPAPNNPNSENSPRLRSAAFASRTFRSKMSALMASLSLAFPHTRGYRSITYM